MSFEQQYIELRKKENRLYSDNQVQLLPDIDPSHPLHNEWRIRKDSLRKLIEYLRRKNRPLRILEVGCGNGWLSARLAATIPGRVTGLDINTTELDQARRVFRHLENLNFILGNIEDLAGEKFDIIIFAASIQYFASLTDTLETALPMLQDNGEIHIVDTHFYKPSEVNSARKRSADYFESMGFAELAKFYFHYSFESLQPFNYKILYNPKALANKLKTKKNPFYWIRVSK